LAAVRHSLAEATHARAAIASLREQVDRAVRAVASSTEPVTNSLAAATWSYATDRLSVGGAAFIQCDHPSARWRRSVARGHQHRVAMQSIGSPSEPVASPVFAMIRLLVRIRCPSAAMNSAKAGVAWSGATSALSAAIRRVFVVTDGRRKGGNERTRNLRDDASKLHSRD
jgi:hypothetical protein